MNIAIAPSEISECFARMRDHRSYLYAADEELVTARNNFETGKYGLVVAKQFSATNESGRELEARAKLPEQWAALLAAERTQREARLRVTLDDLDREELKLRLRLAELRAGENQGYQYQVLHENGAE